jgi:hypothetical protein
MSKCKFSYILEGKCRLGENSKVFAMDQINPCKQILWVATIQMFLKR